MVTVHGWLDRAVHGWIVFTLGPGHLPRRMGWWQKHWWEAGSLAAAQPPLALPPNWTSSAAGRPDRCLQTRRPACGTQKPCIWTEETSQSDVAAVDRHLSLFVDVSTLALGSSSVFFLLIFLCLTVPLSDFPLGSSVKPLVIWYTGTACIGHEWGNTLRIQNYAHLKIPHERAKEVIQNSFNG